MAITEHDLLNALKARLERALKANGYRTDAGENVHKNRTRVSPETDAFPLITVVITDASFKRQSLSPPTYQQDTEFTIVGAIPAQSDEPDLALDLAMDMKRAAFEPIEDDAFSQCVDLFEPLDLTTYHAPEGEPITEIHFIVHAVWCDDSLEH